VVFHVLCAWGYEKGGNRRPLCGARCLYQEERPGLAQGTVGQAGTATPLGRRQGRGSVGRRDAGVARYRLVAPRVPAGRMRRATWSQRPRLPSPAAPTAPSWREALVLPGALLTEDEAMADVHRSITRPGHTHPAGARRFG